MFFQWYLLGFILLMILFTKGMAFCRVEYFYGKRERRYNYYCMWLIAIPLIYLAATRSNMVFGDTDAYKIMFNSLPEKLSGATEFLSNQEKDVGFAVLSIWIKSIIGNKTVIYFGIISTICIVSVLCTYRRYSCSFWISVFLFVASGDYIQWNYNGIRQFIPVAILFACFSWIEEKKYVHLILLILLLSTIHASALIMIPFIFIVQGKSWNFKTISLLIMIVVAILGLDRFTDMITFIMENSQYSREVNQYLSTEGTNYLRVLVFSIPTFLSLLFKRRIDALNKSYVNICVNMSIASLGLYIVSAFTSGIFIGRLPIYFSLYNYILLPEIIDNVFEEKSAKIVYAVMVLAYLVFYYFQVVVTWGL